MAAEGIGAMEAQYILKHHQHDPKENQCSSFLIRHMEAPVHIVWSVVRQFDKPQDYKPFVIECTVDPDTDFLKVGSLRHVSVQSGLPATKSTDMLSVLDDEEHIIGVRFVGGDHRLKNYSSILTVHANTINGKEGSIVIESFVVDIPEGNNDDDTCYLVKAYLNLNFLNLRRVAEKMAGIDIRAEKYNNINVIRNGVNSGINNGIEFGNDNDNENNNGKKDKAGDN